MSVTAKLSTGQGQGQVTKCHERSQESKILFRMSIDQIKRDDSFSNEHMIYSYFCTYNFFARIIKKSRPFCNLTPYKPTTEKGRVNPGSHKVKF